ncbi:DUF664 domain-containing protein [Streptomyces sp. NPDC088246]|uniref:mycothiol transferase n=1 Tax=Streptomyces sp. NPDC088246 TaxID=3365842 RepID=UPI00382E2752
MPRTSTDTAWKCVSLTPSSTPLLRTLPWAGGPTTSSASPTCTQLRDVLLHVITETACHASHLDAVREHIDDRRWVVLT